MAWRKRGKNNKSEPDYARTNASPAKTDSPAGAADKSVAILLALYNGEAFIGRQVETLARQSVPRIDLWVSDDGSTDSSPAIIREAGGHWAKGNVHLMDGPRRGFSENFRALITNAGIEADYFAFCDQDDVWDDDKLASGLEWLSLQQDSVPALFCSRTRTMTSEDEVTGLSPLFSKKPSFRNALVQNIGGGNTMVMNRAAREILREASGRTSFMFHDWWSYMIVTGAGGVVHYSPVAKIGYRQHAANLVGENNSWRARIDRLSHLLTGVYVKWNGCNLSSLAACEDLLGEEARETIRLFAKARSEPSLFKRLRMLWRSGVYRQTRLGHIALYVACILKRL